jgi:hypothetical protein
MQEGERPREEKHGELESNKEAVCYNTQTKRFMILPEIEQWPRK